MAVNLAARLRDAVDMPLVDVVGEDPADFDLPWLSSRIRRRRRARAGARSAVGVAAAGAVALAGVHGVGGRGADAAPPVAPPVRATDLCGVDVSSLSAAENDARLVPPSATLRTTATGLQVSDDSTDLGAFAGRRITTTVLRSGIVTESPADATLALTSDSTVVAVGSAELDAASMGFGLTTLYSFTADVVACGGGAAPAGTYGVQYVTTGPQGTPVRAGLGPWVVHLLDEPVPGSVLADGYPADDVPVVSGDVLDVTETGTHGWQVEVAVAGEDGLVRAADLLRGAGAEVRTSESVGLVQESGGVRPGLDAPEIAELQRQADVAAAEWQAAQARADLAVASGDDEAFKRALDDAAAATQASVDIQGEIADAMHGITSTPRTYRIQGPTRLAATTASWDVTVEAQTQGDSTVLTYRLTAR